MFSSFGQYMLLAPSFTNVINVYAFCNLHDVSWGTKGSDKVDVLPSATSKKGKEDQPAVIEDVAKVQEDVDAAFKETVQRAVTKVKVVESVEKPTQDDENKTFRTRFVAFWMLTNATLAVSIEFLNGLPTNSADDQRKLQTKQNTYFEIILWSTFGLSFIRFLGVCTFPFYTLHYTSDVLPLVLVLFLQAQPLQVLPPQLKSSFRRKSTSRRFPFFSLLTSLHNPFWCHLMPFPFLPSLLSSSTPVEHGPITAFHTHRTTHTC